MIRHCSNRLLLACLLLACVCLKARTQEAKNGLRTVGVNYYLEHVWEPADLNWHILSVETSWRMGSRTDGVSAVCIPRLNLGERTGNGSPLFTRPALQGQLDAYVVFSRRINLAANYGYSGASAFARHQGSLELTYMLDKGWGITAASKITRWDHTAVAYTLGGEKYLGNFWITLRPMLVVQQGEVFPAVRGGVRYFTADKDAYLHLGVSYGNSPEYANWLPDLKQILSLGSWGSFVDWKQPLGRQLVLGLSISYRREEYKEQVWRHVMGAHAGLTFKF